MVMGYLMVHFPTVYFCVFFLIFYNKILKRKKRVEIAELVNLKTSFHAVMYRKTNFDLQMIKKKKERKENLGQGSNHAYTDIKDTSKDILRGQLTRQKTRDKGIAGSLDMSLSLV